jgi:hypothetical protein
LNPILKPTGNHFGEGQKATKQKTSAFKDRKVSSPTVPRSWLDGVPQPDILRPDFKRATSNFPTDADEVDWTLSEGERETSAPPVRAKQPTSSSANPTPAEEKLVQTEKELFEFLQEYKRFDLDAFGEKAMLEGCQFVIPPEVLQGLEKHDRLMSAKSHHSI